MNRRLFQNYNYLLNKSVFKNNISQILFSTKKNQNNIINWKNINNKYLKNTKEIYNKIKSQNFSTELNKTLFSMEESKCLYRFKQSYILFYLIGGSIFIITDYDPDYDSIFSYIFFNALFSAAPASCIMLLPLTLPISIISILFFIFYYQKS